MTGTSSQYPTDIEPREAANDRGAQVTCQRWPGGLCPHCGYRACAVKAQARADVRLAMLTATEKMYDGQAFAAQIRHRMAALRINQKQAAAQAGVQASALCRLLGDNPRGPSVETYLRLLFWLGNSASPGSACEAAPDVSDTGPGMPSSSNPTGQQP